MNTAPSRQNDWLLGQFLPQDARQFIFIANELTTKRRRPRIETARQAKQSSYVPRHHAVDRPAVAKKMGEQHQPRRIAAFNNVLGSSDVCLN